MHYYKDDVNLYNNDEFDLNPDDLMNTEIKINPSFYIHYNLLKAQDSLVKDSVRDGFLQYMINADHCETLARSSNNLPVDYEKLIEKKQKELCELYPDDIERINLQLARYKYQIILTEVFTGRISRKPLQMNSKNGILESQTPFMERSTSAAQTKDKEG